jgi:hypothetical protein
MKKTLIALTLLSALFLIVGCATPPEPDVMYAPRGTSSVKSYPPQLLEHKGTAAGRGFPAWMDAALSGSKAVEKLPDFQGQYIVVVQQDGSDLAGTQLAAGRLDAQAVIAQMVSTRVSDTFAGAQVGDKDKIETYMERCIKSVANARFTGFSMEADWWSRLQTFTNTGRPDKQVYRVIQIWGVDKALLQQQIQQILKDAATADDKAVPDKQKAIDLVQQSFMNGF